MTSLQLAPPGSGDSVNSAGRRNFQQNYPNEPELEAQQIAAATKEEPLKELRENFVKEMQKLSVGTPSPRGSSRKKKTSDPKIQNRRATSATDPAASAFANFRKNKYVNMRQIPNAELRELIETVNVYPCLFTAQERMDLLRENFQRTEMKGMDPPELPPKLK